MTLMDVDSDSDISLLGDEDARGKGKGKGKATEKRKKEKGKRKPKEVSRTLLGQQTVKNTSRSKPTRGKPRIRVHGTLCKRMRPEVCRGLSRTSWPGVGEGGTLPMSLCVGLLTALCLDSSHLLLQSVVPSSVISF